MSFLTTAASIIALAASFVTPFPPDSGDGPGREFTGTAVVDTTVGRALLWDIVPEGIAYDMVNKPMAR